jgi:hypothetical protein
MMEIVSRGAKLLSDSFVTKALYTVVVSILNVTRPQNGSGIFAVQGQ